MNTKLINRVFAALAFLITLATYVATLQPSVPFWDCGEFTAASTWQQVCHPPGAPLFLMVGRIFQIIIPFGDLGWRVNLVSAFAGAFTVMLLYLSIVKVIQNFRKEKIETLSDIIIVYGSALVGALSFTFSDSFWFNSVESEVYASAALFMALVVYLILRWNEIADEPGHERYLMLIAYLIGLSLGVHLLSILTIFSVTMIVYYRKYKLSFKSFIVMGIIAIILFWMINGLIYNWMPVLLAGDTPFKNAANERLIENSPIIMLIGIGIIIAAFFGFWYGRKNNKSVLQLATLAFIFILFGYGTYTQVLIRANANPPMNENEPKDFRKLTSYIGREQYGEQVLWPRRTDYNDELKTYYYNLKDENGNYVYGEWNPPSTERVKKKDGTEIGKPLWDNVNVSGDLTYMWKYQIDHMFLRYWFWNYVGKVSDVQDAEDSWFNDKDEAKVMNFNSGYASQFPVHFWGIPLLFGLIGIYYQFKKDWRMASAFLAMFLVMGVVATLIQNQQNPQPRERDYFYEGAFMVYSLWVGLGAFALVDMFVKNKRSALAPAIVIIISIVAVPFNMAAGGWKIHNRAGNFIPFDYSYNILQSTDKDAILFTNGDNDTFPVWFLQDVEGVRRDVRVVNLSLGQTLWYIDELKNREPWGAKKIPLSFSDESIQTDENDEKALSYEFGEAKEIVIPVKKEIMEKFTDNPALINDGNMRFTFVGKPYGEQNGKQNYLFLVNNKLILDIVKQTKFERPVYFSTTVGPDVYSGLGKHLRMEGMAMRVCPVPAEQTKTGMIEPDIMGKCLMNIDNSDNFYKEPHYGFKLRNLNNMNVYYDEVHRRLIANYRQLYTNYAIHFIDKKDNARTKEVLDVMNKNISTTQFPLSIEEMDRMATIYDQVGDKENAQKFAKMAIEKCNEIIANPKLRSAGGVESQIGEVRGAQGVYRTSADAYRILGDYDAARKMLNNLYSMTRQAVSSLGNQLGQNDMQAIQRNMYEIFSMMARNDEAELSKLEQEGKKDQALARAKELQKTYSQSNDELMKSLEAFINQRIMKMEGKAPAPDTAANKPAPAAQ